MPTIMSTSHGTHEITEWNEKYESESKISRDTKKQHSGKTLKRHSIEDDINELFEAIDIGSPRLGVCQFRDKSAMKRPMRVRPSDISGIGISESMSLKQTLRGLCISQASEMAAVRKRMLRPSASPGISETGAVKKLYRTVVIEEKEDGKSNDESRGNLVEISLVPEISPSKFSEKTLESGHGCQLAKANEEISNLIKSPNRHLGLTERGLRTQDFVKNVPNRTFVSKSVCQRNEGAKNDRDYHKGKMVHPTPDSISDEKSRSKEKGEFSQSSKISNIGEYGSTTSYYSEESYLSGSSRSGYRPHMSKDLRWEAISCVQKQNGSLSLKHFKMLRKIGDGDIGTVYLSELIGTSCLFAVKIMDNDFLVGRKKMMRAQTEREIMEILDHPFLPTLYAHFAKDKFSCLVMEYCPGGDLHVLRQKQLTRSFPEKAARFYAAEVLLALEYLHMLGVVYRDLKPENVLVREDGHIMLSDFDLSLRCTVNPTLLKSISPTLNQPKKTSSSPCSTSNCIDPFCLQPSWQLSCFTPRFLSTRKIKSELASQVIPLPQLVVEPTDARSNSFVGTHEYLAPEIVKGDGHGSPVDWWTFGILLYELLYGGTPFKGSSNEETVSNVVSRCLKFPHCPMVSCHARDLIRRLLRKEPENRLGWEKGAAEIKGHPFFDGLNWALIRCETPPEMPKVFDLGNVVPDAVCESKNEMEFEMF